MDAFLTLSLLIIMLGISFVLGFLMGYSNGNKDNNTFESQLPELYCFECEIEMPVKEKKGVFYCKNCGLRHNMETYSITEVCPHDIARIKVISTCVTCETTQLICADCGEALEPPKTEC